MATSTALWIIVSGTGIGALVGLGLAWYGWRHRDVEGAVPYASLSLAITGWSFLHAAVLLTGTEDLALWLARFSAVPAIQIPPLWLVFALVYTGRREWLTRRRLVALWTYPTVYVAAIFTADLHGLAARSVEFVTVNGITAPVIERALAYQGQLVFTYIYVLAGFLLLAQFFVRSRQLARNQTGAIIVGSLFPLIGNAMYTSLGGFLFHPAVDLTPIMFAVNGGIIGWALFRYDFLSVSPAASQLLAEELPDPVVVVNDDEVIVDYNPAAQRVLPADSLANKPVSEIRPGLIETVERGEVVRFERDEVGNNRDTAVFDPRTRTIEDQRGQEHGRLILFREITAQQRRLEQLESLQSSTSQFIQARSPEEVEDVAVDFTARALGISYCAFFRYDPDSETLEATRMTEPFSDVDEVLLPSGESAVWSAFTSSDERVARLDVEDVIFLPDSIDPPTVLVFTVGKYGVLVAGHPEDDGISQAQEQLAVILARTSETALTRIEGERQLRESQQALERRKEQIEFFNGVLRHNIRNGMMVISGHAEYLRGQTDYGDEKLDTIDDWSQDLIELTEKIGTINDTVTASAEKRLHAVNLSSLLDDQMSDLERAHDGVEVDGTVPEGIIVEANELLKDVLEVVFGNCVEHNDKDVVQVSVTANRDGENIRIRIADNGPGISDDMKGHVFDRDVRTSQTAAGFGLYFVSVMLDIYGGDVWYEDNEPMGAVAVLEFPLAAGAPVAE